MAGRPPQEITSLYNFQPIFGGFKFFENFFSKNVQVVIGHDKMIRDSAGSGARKWSRQIFADLQIAQSACSSLLLLTRHPISTKTRLETKSWSAAGRGTAAAANGSGIKRAAMQLIGFVTLHEVIRKVRAIPPE